MNDAKGMALGALLLAGGAVAGWTAARSVPVPAPPRPVLVEPATPGTYNGPGLEAFVRWSQREGIRAYASMPPGFHLTAVPQGEFDAWLREMDRREASNDPLGIRDGLPKPKASP